MFQQAVIAVIDSSNPLASSEMSSTEGLSQRVVNLIDTIRSSPNLRDYLLEWYQCDDAEKALVEMGNLVVTDLIQALQDPNARVRKHVANVLGRIGVDAGEAVPVLRTFLKDTSAIEVSQSAARALGLIGSSSAISDLIEVFRQDSKQWDHEYDVLVSCSRSALRKIGQPAVSGLIRALKDDFGAVRYHATVTLGEMGSQAIEAVPALLDVVQHDDYGMRGAAASSLGKIGSKDAAVVLRKLVNDLERDIELQQAALRQANEAVKKLS